MATPTAPAVTTTEADYLARRPDDVTGFTGRVATVKARVTVDQPVNKQRTKAPAVAVPMLARFSPPPVTPAPRKEPR